MSYRDDPFKEDKVKEYEKYVLTLEIAANYGKVPMELMHFTGLSYVIRHAGSDYETGN